MYSGPIPGNIWKQWKHFRKPMLTNHLPVSEMETIWKHRRPNGNVPTTSAQDRLVITDQISAAQVNALRKNCAEFGIEFFDVQDRDQGIVHMIGPELGATKPGSTIVCGDSHTSTHGAFGALAFGIGTSEVEHVMATQTLPQSKPTTFRITVDGDLPLGVTGVGRGSWR